MKLNACRSHGKLTDYLILYILLLTKLLHLQITFRVKDIELGIEKKFNWMYVNYFAIANN